MLPRRFLAICSIGAALSLAAAAPPVPPTPEAPAAPERVWVGVFLGDAVDGGVQVLEVVPGGPAAKAGILSGDLVIRIDGKDVAEEGDLSKALARHAPGESVGLTILRGGETKDKTLVLGSSPRVLRLPPPPPMAVEEPESAMELLGIEVGEIPADLRTHLGGPSDAGLLVVRVEPNGIAAKALRVGDLLVTAGGKSVATEADLDRAVLERSSGPMTVAGLRSKAPFSASVELRLKSPEQRQREARVRTLEMTIRRLESQLDQLKRELNGLKGTDAP